MTDHAKICHDIAVANGFWSDGKTPKGEDAITWRQLCHIVDETCEYLLTDDFDEFTEELADVVIVILDLLAAYSFSVDLDWEHHNTDLLEYTDIIFSEIIVFSVGHTANVFRKTVVLISDDLLDIIHLVDYMCDYVFKVNLIDLVNAKCEKNKKRGKGYGVK